MNAIETSGISFRYSSKQQVLSNLNLQVPENSIYGFLGANGAGKTTTLRLLLGLLRLQHGMVNFFGQSFERNRIKILKNTGSMIETPSFYNHLTAVENLLVLQKIYRFPGSEIKKVLQTTGLAATRNKKAGQFSLGMKQRLGIAIALAHSPKLLILDEPTNGLDPAGIIEIRELLKKLHKENGITILVSSHLLSEMEKLATHVGIIHSGSIVFQGTLEELNRKQHASSRFVIETNDPFTSLGIIKEYDATAMLSGDKIIFSHFSNECIASINEQLVQRGIKVFRLSSEISNLETIFMSLTHN